MVENLTLGGDLTVNHLGYGAMPVTDKGIWGPPEYREKHLTGNEYFASLFFKKKCKYQQLSGPVTRKRVHIV